MTNLHINRWSETLRQQTRTALEQLVVSADGYIHFKHQLLGFATSAIEDLVYGRMVLKGKVDGKEYLFQNADDLLQAGWAID